MGGKYLKLDRIHILECDERKITFDHRDLVAVREKDSHWNERTWKRRSSTKRDAARWAKLIVNTLSLCVPKYHILAHQSTHFHFFFSFLSVFDVLLLSESNAIYLHNYNINRLLLCGVFDFPSPFSHVFMCLYAHHSYFYILLSLSLLSCIFFSFCWFNEPKFTRFSQRKLSLFESKEHTK